MSGKPTRRDRRRFLRLAVAGGLAAPAALVTSRTAGAAGRPRLDPDSKRARQVDYTPAAASSDNPRREAGATCRNCVHFRGGAGDDWATCNVFPDHLVGANGWCEAWIARG